MTNWRTFTFTMCFKTSTVKKNRRLNVKQNLLIFLSVENTKTDGGTEITENMGCDKNNPKLNYKTVVCQ